MSLNHLKVASRTELQRRLSPLNHHPVLGPTYLSWGNRMRTFTSHAEGLAAHTALTMIFVNDPGFWDRELVDESVP